jgi:alpha-glucosidase
MIGIRGLAFRARRVAIFAVIIAWSTAASGAAQTAASHTARHAAAPSSGPAWWQHAVIYEIYPRSFQDSNGDGIGDLNGIVSRLDYLESLGVNAIWLTPIFPSPQADFGYDISDFTAIDPLYGTMADFDRLMAEARRHGIRVIMDLVLNHTSDEHPWFKESERSRTNPKRDWYIWRDGKIRPDGSMGPPSNWVNRIEQSPWRYDPKTEQFNYHYYDPKQPDLNWRNPQVEAAMFDAARFWLDKGAAGFRLDAINTLFEAADLADAPPGPGTNEYGERSLSMVRQRNLPEVHDVLRDLRRLTDGFAGDRVLIGEVYTGSTVEAGAWYGTAERPELQLPMNTNVGFLNRLDAAGFRRLLAESEAAFADKMPLYVFDNHDRPRSWDRYGDGGHNGQIARMLAAILLASRSSALIYQGQEIGMVTTTPARREDVRDPRGLAGWPREKGRDGERTPMQWDTTPQAGFTSAVRAWLPIPPTSVQTNVATQSAEADSLLSWYRRLVALKRSRPAMRDGKMILLDRDAQGVLAWIRHADVSGREPSVLVACNMSPRTVVLDVGAEVNALGLARGQLEALMTHGGATAGHDLQVTLAPYATFVADIIEAGEQRHP